MEPTTFDESSFFRSIHASGVRALLIGRRALVLLGLPVLTADYGFWIAIEDIARFNDACLPFGLLPTRSPEEARRSARYLLENDEHVDVLVARSIPTMDGRPVDFEALWSSRQSIEISDGVSISIPAIDDLILTKQIASRPRDLEDIRLLEAIRLGGSR